MRFKKVQLLTMGALVGTGLFNPMSVEVLEDYFKLVYMGVFILCAGWVMGFILYKAFKPEAIKIPAKTAKTQKAGRLIVT